MGRGWRQLVEGDKLTDRHHEKSRKTGLGQRLTCAILLSHTHLLQPRLASTHGCDHDTLGSWHVLSPPNPTPASMPPPTQCGLSLPPAGTIDSHALRDPARDPGVQAGRCETGGGAGPEQGGSQGPPTCWLALTQLQLMLGMWE